MISVESIINGTKEEDRHQRRSEPKEEVFEGFTHMDKWAELPEEVLELIARRTASIEDFFRFSAVCRSWQLATLQKHYYPLLSSWHPWLLLSDREKCDTHNFYSLSSKKFYDVNLPEANACRCWGTPHGWLITIDPNLSLHLLNPISHVQIPLPQHPVSKSWNGVEVLKNFLNFQREFVRDNCIDKVLLSSRTNNVLDQCIVTLYSEFQKLAFVRTGDRAWTTLNIPHRKFRDLICFKGQLYAICCEGKFWLCDIDSSHPYVKCFVDPPKNVGECESLYLLELAEDLHMVRRIYQTDPALDYLVTEFFEVYRLDFSCEKWIEVNNLDDCALYIGRNTSFSVSASQHPELRRNCIYFTDDSVEGLHHGMGVFHFENGTIEPFLADLEKCLWFRKPIWIRPGLC